LFEGAAVLGFVMVLACAEQGSGDKFFLLFYARFQSQQIA
jgi:hypothetical protein